MTIEELEKLADQVIEVLTADDIGASQLDIYMVADMVMEKVDLADEILNGGIQ